MSKSVSVATQQAQSSSSSPAQVLAGRVSLVTGAGSGIGRGIAEQFAAVGSRIAIVDINLPAAQSTADDLNKTHGDGTAAAFLCDVGVDDQVELCVSSVVAKFGRIDVLVNNAGIQHISKLVDFSTADWRRVMSIHVDGAFFFTKFVMRDMTARGEGGTVIFIGSVHSKCASAAKGAYVAAKHALLGMTRSVAKEGAPHKIRANLICPGFVRTPLVEKQIPEQAALLKMTEEDVIKQVMLKDTVTGEFTTIEDVAQACLFFAAHPTSAFTGQSLNVSHGWIMD